MFCIVVGTRPEIIKMAPVIRACQNNNVPFFVLHTGQHYSTNMDSDFFTDLKLPIPKYNLGIGDQPHRKQVGYMVKEITEILKKEKSKVVIVQGDTISVLSASLAANKLGIKVAHHEAGLRSHDPSMIEETNRVTTDHISDFLFAPTKEAVDNLREEKCLEDRIYYIGNTVVDALLQHKDIAEKNSFILENLGLTPKKYFVFTAHRTENVDYRNKLIELLNILDMLYSNFQEFKIVYPVHPRVRKMIKQYSLTLPNNIIITGALPYFDFIKLLKNSSLVITDSGGVQEESCILQIPCVTIRNNTERPETVEGGMNIIAGLNRSSVDLAVKGMLDRKINWSNPFGDGKAAERIIKILKDKLN